ncbi:MAG: glutamate racemase [Bacillota bacterium]
MHHNNLPIGFFDSGLGGVSVLAEAACLLPYESLIYLGDTAHSPYGTKDASVVKRFSLQAVDFLVKKGIKALVVACNTATSVAIKDIREAYDMPVIGMEPALKPAVEKADQGEIVVMATPVTLRERKFHSLLSLYEDNHDIVPLPCPGLVELIEKGIYSGALIQNYLTNIFAPLIKEKISTVVLGCTHYLFIKKELAKFIPHVQIIDGNLGTVKNLQRILSEKGLLANQTGKERTITYYSSGEQEPFLALCHELFNYYTGSYYTQA